MQKRKIHRKTRAKASLFKKAAAPYPTACEIFQNNFFAEYLANIYLFKVNNTNTRTSNEIFSKSTI